MGPGTKKALTLHPLLLTDSRKLRLLQKADAFKQWWSITELRFCAACEHLFIGRDIRVFEDEHSECHFRCPSQKCEGGFAEWEYPQLHL